MDFVAKNRSIDRDVIKLVGGLGSIRVGSGEEEDSTGFPLHSSVLTHVVVGVGLK